MISTSSSTSKMRLPGDFLSSDGAGMTTFSQLAESKNLPHYEAAT
jgi:hypothetical protein